jgi:excisionase family DNA binding protein
MSRYLNSEDAAAYLGIRERKLYDLVATGAVPCSKVTGRWLFPRDALDRWIEAGLARPLGFDPVGAPPIVAGSHDPLLEWALRRADCGLALLSVGSQAGLSRLERNEAAIAAVHLHGAEDEDGNAAALAASPFLFDGVLIAFATREAGLLVAPGNPMGLDGLAAIAMRKARFGQRQAGAGAQLLLEKLCRAAGLAPEVLGGNGPTYATGNDLAFALKADEIDCGIATRAVAQATGLGFVPMFRERFDLCLRRRTAFEPGPQALLDLMRSPEFSRHAAILGGYDLSETGRVRLNR